MISDFGIGGNTVPSNDDPLIGQAVYEWKGAWDPNVDPPVPETWPDEMPDQLPDWPFGENPAEENTNSSFVNLSKAILLIDDKLRHMTNLAATDYAARTDPDDYDTYPTPKTLRELFANIITFDP